jgi:predicted DsbA family dithiol-disulfide isomerase
VLNIFPYFDNDLAQISEQAGSEIGKLHITFNRAADNKALLYYAAEMQLGKAPDSTFMERLFAAIRHAKTKQRQQAIESAFASQNLISPYKLNEQQNKQLINKVNEVRSLTKQSGIHAVPAFIINGRYQVLLKGHKTPDEIANTIKYLLNLS